MGRKSKLTETQWKTLGERLYAGEKAADLSREYGVSKAVISSRFSEKNQNVREVAKKLADAEIAIRELPAMEQRAARTLADDLIDISTSLAAAAKYGARTAHRMMGIADGLKDKISDSDPLMAAAELKAISILTELSKGSAHIGLNLLAANKDMLRPRSDGEESGVIRVTGGLPD